MARRRSFNLRYLLPDSFRSFLISRFLKFETVLDADIEIKQATSISEFEQAFELLHDCYVGLGIMDPEKCGIRCNLYSAVPFTNVIIAKKGDQVVATLSLIQDSAFGLPSDSQYKSENDRLRARSLRLVEVSAMAVHRDYRKSKGNAFINLFMMNYLRRFCQHFLGADQLVVTVHPHAQSFYSALFNFKRSGAVSEYKTVKGALAVYMSMDFSTLEPYLLKKYGGRPDESNLHKFFFLDHINNFIFPLQNTGIFFYPTMNQTALEYFFERRTRLFEKLRPRDLERVKHSYEWADSALDLKSTRGLAGYENSRAKFRLPTRLHARVNAGSSVLPGEIKDLSLNGCLLSSSGAINWDTNKKIAITFNLSTGPHKLSGEIVRMAPSDQAIDGKYCYGVKFTDGISKLKDSLCKLSEATSARNLGLPYYKQLKSSS